MSNIVHDLIGVVRQYGFEILELKDWEPRFGTDGRVVMWVHKINGNPYAKQPDADAEKA